MMTVVTAALAACKADVNRPCQLQEREFQRLAGPEATARSARAVARHLMNFDAH